jgi:hypothetical protein
LWHWSNSAKHRRHGRQPNAQVILMLDYYSSGKRGMEVEIKWPVTADGGHGFRTWARPREALVCLIFPIFYLN